MSKSTEKTSLLEAYKNDTTLHGHIPTARQVAANFIRVSNNDARVIMAAIQDLPHEKKRHVLEEIQHYYSATHPCSDQRQQFTHTTRLLKEKSILTAEQEQTGFGMT